MRTFLPGKFLLNSAISSCFVRIIIKPLNSMKFSILAAVLSALFPFCMQGQSDSYTYHFKKGEVLDILLITTVPEADELLERYKKTAFPVAFEYSYKSIPGYKISSLSLGNHLPNSFILGKWESLAKREGFLLHISDRVPDFHQQRRDLFTYFGLTYYEMQKETQFSLSKSKYKVISAFWQKDPESMHKFLKGWQKELKQAGAEICIKLQGGTSPLGYAYNPDVLYIVQWEDQASFEAFSQQYPLERFESLKNVHQLVLE